MLTCYGDTIRLPQNQLAYVAFRLAFYETLSDIELQIAIEEEADPPAGYLSEVPFLEQVPLPVQMDLLADTWDRHRQRTIGMEIPRLLPRKRFEQAACFRPLAALLIMAVVGPVTHGFVAIPGHRCRDDD